MAEPMDPGTRAKYLYVLSQWDVNGYVVFNERSQAWILGKWGCDQKLLARAMYDHVRRGGEIRRVREQGDASVYQNEFHDDLVFSFRRREVYVETIFFDDRDPEWCRIDVVNIKYNK